MIIKYCIRFLSCSVFKSGFWLDGNHCYLGYLCLIPLAIVLLIPAFPVLTLMVKLISLFHDGKEWNKLKILMTVCELWFEKYFEFNLQGWIRIYKLRVPPTIQDLSLFISVATYFVGVANIFKDFHLLAIKLHMN